jgi:hypothetical protein
MFKVPSLQNVLNETGYTLKRFPLPLLSSITAVFIAIHLTHADYEQRKSIEYLWKIIMCCSLALNLTLAGQLFSESKNLGKTQNILLQSVVVAIIFTYYFLLPQFNDFTLKDAIRYILFNIGTHLLVSFSPFIANDQKNGFWQFNKSLFLRFLTSALYSGVLYIGLALAILAVDELFKVNINDKWYADLWFILAGIFNTCFFLTGVPKQTQTLEAETAYPKGLKIFTQFVLLPLVAIYLLILYAYGIKIAISMELPRGWVSYLVIGFSIAGILSLLLIWPIRNEKDNNWIQITYKWFYRALYPLIILLCLAIYKRVSEYGITENRYFILIIAIWLTCIASYFLFSKIKNIKLIPISLCVIAFLSSFGPWGVFSVAEQSQVNRLEKLLIEEKLLVDGKVKKSNTLLQNKNSQKIASIVNYLDKNHGFTAIQPWFSQNLDSLFVPKDSASQYVYKTGIVLDLMGVSNSMNYSLEGEKHFYIHSEYSNKAINVKGFDLYASYHQYFYANDTNNSYIPEVYFENDTLKINVKNNQLQIYQNSLFIKSVDFKNFVRNVQQHQQPDYENKGYPKELLTLPITTDSLQLQFNFTSIQGTIDDNDSIKINSVDADLLIKHN